MKYFITGNSYQIKEDLKAFGCYWDNNKKRWETPTLIKDELVYKRIKSLCEAVGADINPEKLTKECETIQSILNK